MAAFLPNQANAGDGQSGVVVWGPMTANGDYGVGKLACELSVNTTSTSATVTVVVARGTITLGTVLVGAGIPAGAYVSAFGTGTGGAGTYTISAAATATAEGVSIKGYEPGVAAEKYTQRSLQVNGGFGTSGAVQLQGSNDGVNFYQLADLGGTAISFTAAGLKGTRDHAKWLRPKITAGSGAISLTMSLLLSNP